MLLLCDGLGDGILELNEPHCKNWTCCENAVQNSFDTAIAGRYPPNRRHDDANI